MQGADVELPVAAHVFVTERDHSHDTQSGSDGPCRKLIATESSHESFHVTDARRIRFVQRLVIEPDAPLNRIVP